MNPLLALVGVGAGLLLLGTLTNKESSTETVTLTDEVKNRLRELLDLEDEAPVYVGNFTAGQTVSTSGVYVDRMTGVVYATEANGTTLIRSEKLTAIMLDSIRQSAQQAIDTVTSNSGVVV